MVSESIYLVGVIFASLMLLVGTVIIVPAYRHLYANFGLYHPTQKVLEQYTDDELDIDKDKIHTETLAWKIAATFGINFIIGAITLVVMLVYIVLLLAIPISIPALAAAMMYMVSINSGLRLASLTSFPFGYVSVSEDSNVMLLGANFFTSLTLLAALGSILSFVAGNITKVVSKSFENGFGSPKSAVMWATAALIFMIVMSGLLEKGLESMVDEGAVVIVESE